MNGPDYQFRAAKKCTGGACVEIAALTDKVLVRDGKDREGGVLSFGAIAWMNFVDAVKSGTVASVDER